MPENHIFLQYRGPDGELGASLRYLSQRYSAPYPEVKAVLTDIGTEELGHLEMVGTIVYQLTKDLSLEEIKAQGFGDYFIDHTTAIYPQASSGTPFSAAALQVKGDIITDLHEDLAAEQKARTTYDNILRFCDDPDVKDAIRFLRAREVVHYQRFGEALRTKCSGLIIAKIIDHNELKHPKPYMYKSTLRWIYKCKKSDADI